MSRGKLVVFEGLDGAGKSTQLALLGKWLHQHHHDVVHTVVHFPFRESDIGRVIDRFLLKQIALPCAARVLLFAANRRERGEEIESLLASGTWVLADRYTASGCAYAPLELRPLVIMADAGMPVPDLTFYLRLSVAEADERRPIHPDDVQLQTDAKTWFDAMMTTWCTLDATCSVSDVHRRVINVFEQSNLVPDKTTGEPSTIGSRPP